MKTFSLAAQNLLNDQESWDYIAHELTAEYLFDPEHTWGNTYTIQELFEMLNLVLIRISNDDAWGIHVVFVFEDDIIFQHHSTGKHDILFSIYVKNSEYDIDILSHR
jgi:hypothetical protein